MNYTVCNPTAVWAGPGSPDTPPPPPSTGSGNSGGGSSGGGTGGSQSEEDRRRICNQNADVAYATCASNFMNNYSTTMTNDCSKFGPISPLFSNCQAVAQARRDVGIANCQVTKATYIAQVCQ